MKEVDIDKEVVVIISSFKLVRYSHLVVWLLFHFLTISFIPSLSSLPMSEGW